MNMLQSNGNGTQEPEKKLLIGKAWIKSVDKGFRVAWLTEKVEGTKADYKISDIFPLICNEDAQITFGPNAKHDEAKNNNTHWVFLNVKESKLDDYAKLCEKIGQVFDASAVEESK